jgi:hypothetical protein
VIWNNASTDGTTAFLETLDDPRIRVVNSEKNIGQNAYARAFQLTTSPYMVEVDDDVVDAPVEWDRNVARGVREVAPHRLPVRRPGGRSP